MSTNHELISIAQEAIAKGEAGAVLRDYLEDATHPGTLEPLPPEPAVAGQIALSTGEPRFRCPRHGIINGSTVTFKFGTIPNPHVVFCMLCIKDLLCRIITHHVEPQK